MQRQSGTRERTGIRDGRCRIDYGIGSTGVSAANWIEREETGRGKRKKKNVPIRAGPFSLSVSSASVHFPSASLTDTTCGLPVNSSRTSTVPFTFCRRVEMRFASLMLNTSNSIPRLGGAFQILLFSHPIPVPVQHNPVLLLLSHFEITSTGGSVFQEPTVPKTATPFNSPAPAITRYPIYLNMIPKRNDSKASGFSGWSWMSGARRMCGV